MSYDHNQQANPVRHLCRYGGVNIRLPGANGSEGRVRRLANHCCESTEDLTLVPQKLVSELFTEIEVVVTVY